LKSTQINEAPHVTPLPGWAVECEHGHQASDGTPAGRLVRLATVVQWLQESQSLPRVSAVELLCSKLDERALGALHVIQSGRFAARLPQDSLFGFRKPKPVQTSARHPAAPSFVVPSFLATYADRPRFNKAPKSNTAKPAQPEVSPGLPALLARLSIEWGARAAPKQCRVDPLNDTRTLSAFLAVPMTLAHDLWGWGVVSVPADGAQTPLVGASLPDKVDTYVDLLRVRAAAPGAKWLPDMLRALQAEEQSRQRRPGAKGVRAELARELGLQSVQRVGQLLALAAALPPAPLSIRPGASVFNIA
jgi:hypothetical protein